MRLEYLRDFIKLAKYKSFSKLAQDLSISQSTLSHRIAQLEEELYNLRLINRTTKTFELTSEGRIVLKHTIKILRGYDEMLSELSKLSEKITESIVITASTMPGSQIIPKLIAQFKEEHSNVDFKILINNTSKSIKHLLDDRADFAAIGSFMDFDPKIFDYKVIGTDKLTFVCSPNHPLLKKGEVVNFEHLSQYPMIIREVGSGTRNILEKQFPKFSSLKIELEINDNDSIITAVSESNYLSVLSESIAEKAREAKLIEIISLKEHKVIAKRELYLIKKKGETESSNLKYKFWESFPTM